MSEQNVERPIALCCCGTPLVGTLEMPGAEWYCVTCERFHGWLHARKGDGPNPTPELEARAVTAQEQYDAERDARRAAAR